MIYSFLHDRSSSLCRAKRLIHFKISESRSCTEAKWTVLLRLQIMSSAMVAKTPSVIPGWSNSWTKLVSRLSRPAFTLVQYLGGGGLLGCWPTANKRACVATFFTNGSPNRTASACKSVTFSSSLAMRASSESDSKTRVQSCGPMFLSERLFSLVDSFIRTTNWGLAPPVSN